MKPKKIDIYVKHFKTKIYKYVCSSLAYPTCKSAKHNFCVIHCLDKSQVKCNYSTQQGNK